ncbi:DUF551 domain-containing protein [Cupriavidus sp. RAF12]|uniref:DUF551 domain-containing protein n=1 Tax=Cupriavidus sp. RAF12 TaxID=3233050 RepID=UPI003F8F1AFD
MTCTQETAGNKPADGLTVTNAMVYAFYGAQNGRSISPNEFEGFRVGIRAALLAAPAAAPAWIPAAENMPKLGQTVLATYLNRAGKPRTIRAKYIPAKAVEANTDSDAVADEYDEATDTYWLQAGWYEQIDNWDDYTSVQVCEGEITHWMPMPAAPNGDAVNAAAIAADSAVNVPSQVRA